MPSYCTVCGVKLTAKNRISYRPSSCRDCELERKRLYSLKRKLQKEQEKNGQGKKEEKAPKTAAKKKAAPKTKVIKATTSKAKIVTRKVTSKAASTSTSSTSRAKKSTTKSSSSKAASTATKAKTSKEQETKTIKATKTSTATKAKTIAAKTSTKATPVKKDEKAPKAASKEKKASPAKAERASAPEKKVAKSKVKPVEKKEANPFMELPDYIKESAKIKVKKRRLASNSSKKETNSANQVKISSSEEDASHIFALGTDLTEDDLLRAPSNTPWDSSSFKIINGSFVEHGAEDIEESKGPSPEEIKNIIEKIRLEHKTRRS
ncbi:MAG: hypothetical protein MK033_00080 [Candidatus Caenarcaniphilales bacterium]|nr:hypothetical protein [Candidatus Caenarcaniphilales bacterium]